MSCLSCGRCCMFLILPYIVEGKENTKDIANWIRLHHFIPVGSDNKIDEIIIPIKCSNFENGKCKDYENRPNVCKDYLCKRAINGTN